MERKKKKRAGGGESFDHGLTVESVLSGTLLDPKFLSVAEQLPSEQRAHVENQITEYVTRLVKCMDDLSAIISDGDNATAVREEFEKIFSSVVMNSENGAKR